MTSVPAAPRFLDRHFRWRGANVSRVEAFSDAVFAIALALLFLQATVPTSFDDLEAAMKGLVPFAACFAIIAYVWVEHWLYSRRYDLHDGWATFLHLLLLFLLLFYAYPLKYLFTLLFVGFCGPIDGDTNLTAMLAGFDGAADSVKLFAFYGFGYGAIFAVLALLYGRALAFADRLGLDDVERFLTRSGRTQALLQAGVAALSIVLAVIGLGRKCGLPGWVYCLIGPLMAWHGVREGRQVKSLLARRA
jgi:hypothetical protein